METTRTSAPTPTVKKKRNVKQLQLNVSQPSVEPPRTTRQAPSAPAGARQAPSAPAGGRRKPPAMDLSKSKQAPKEDSDNKLLSVAPSTSAPSSATSNRNKLTEQLEKLDIGGDAKFDLRNDDLRNIGELGHGNGGTVAKVEHIPTGTIMAKKVVLIDAKPSVRKQILRELQIMHDCHSSHIVSFHGAFVSDPHICICMEFMDKGSLDGIYKKNGAIDIAIVAQIALAVLEGLTYLYDVHRIIHRDIKPSNILFNSQGQIKICDFGVSGELINSIADTFVGTSTYMSPERIQGAQYTVKSDVWSLGISLIELALGRFPFADSDSDSDSDLSDLESTLSPMNLGGRSSLLMMSSDSAVPLPPPRRRKPKTVDEKKDRRKSKGVSLQGGGMTMSILELLQHIVNEPAPKLTPENRFPRDSEEFTALCLEKEPLQRPTPKELLKHSWIVNAKKAEVDLKGWAATI